MMELDTLLERLQSTLLHNDKRLEIIDARRDELKRISKEEEEKITALCTEIQGRVGAAGESLKSKSMIEFNKLDEELNTSKWNITRDSRILCTELDKLTELVKSGEESKIDVAAACWDKVKHITSVNKESQVEVCNPTFHPSKTLAKVKYSDIGYIKVAEFHPHQFQLSLTYPTHNILEAGLNKKVICTVLTSELFSDMIQANIKFSIKNKGCKDAVPYCKEECKLSSDKKSFQIAFLTTKPGTYVVTVLLYDQHVMDSPLSLTASEPHNIFENKVFIEQQISEVESPKEDKKDYKLRNSQINIGNVSCNENKESITESCPAPAAIASVANIATVSPTPISPVNVISKSDSNSNAATNSSSKPMPSKLRRQSPSVAVSTQYNEPSSIKSVLPSGPLDLSPLATGSGARLAGLRMLSIEEGTKDESLHKPIGMCLLLDGNIAVASTFENKVKIFTSEGKFVVEVISPEPPFDRPSDMVTLFSGEFVVRDNTRVQVFSSNGNFIKNMWQDKGHDRCYGLAQDKEGRLVTIMESRRPRKTDLLFFNLGTGELVKKIEMEDIIPNMSMSKCRFLTYQLGKLYITDLGMDCVYVLDPNTVNTKVFGSSGSGPGELSDPAGLVVDIAGNIIVADSKNHRLCVFSSEGKYVCDVKLSPPTRRPSGVVLDKGTKDIFVLNLQGKLAMTKYRLK